VKDISGIHDVLRALGVSDDEVASAEASGTLMALAAERFLLPGERVYDHHELAERVGVRADELARLWLALGFAPTNTAERAFTDADVKVIRTLVADGTELSSEYTLHEARVISSALARIAEVFIDEMWDHHRSAGQSDEQVVAEMAGIDVGRVERLLLSLLRRHLVAAIYRRAALHDQSQRLGQASLAVGFADLTGFTELSRGLTAQELTRLIVTFEQRAFDLIAEMGGRVVKTIGDEVMFTFDVAPVAAELALRLSDANDPTVPPLRIGLAYGPALVRQGDCYGPTVNLASRIAGVATSGEVVVDAALAHAVDRDSRFMLTSMGEVTLKGFGPVALSLLSRAQ
jgi:adenylate cyclase